ncbi:MAG: hypothetical protein AABW56_05085, partial [Nanoarchaeota archaeon]
IEKPTLLRAINEAKILSLFPKISKSKSSPLSTIKIYRELELFAKYYNINKIAARHFYKSVKEWRKKLEENPKILLTSIQQDLVIGSTLGDGYIRQRQKNCNFRVGHTKKQEK